MPPPNVNPVDEYVVVKYPACDEYPRGKYRLQHFKTVTDERISSVRCAKFYGKSIQIRDIDDGLAKGATLHFGGICNRYVYEKSCLSV